MDFADRYFYAIEPNVISGKLVHIYGYICYNDTDDSESNYRICECVGLYLEPEVVAHFTAEDIVSYVDEHIAYIDDVTKQEAEYAMRSYFDSEVVSELNICCVDSSTLLGNYWFDCKV